MLSNIISIIALLVAFFSFGFTLFQYRRSQSISKLQKVNEVLTFAFSLRSKSQDLRDFIGRTDDIDEQDKFFDKFDLITEVIASKAISNPKFQSSEVYKMEARLLGLDLELNLLNKQIKKIARFNEEVAELEANS